MPSDEREQTAGLVQLRPLVLLDRALYAVHCGGFARIARAWLNATALVLVALVLYDFERIEGEHRMRPLFALAFAAAFILRALGASRLARSYAGVIRPSLRLDAAPTPAADVIATAALVGIGLSLWLWPLALLARIAPLAVAAGVPLLALRGAIAPSWLARASCAPERGFRALGQALDDTAGMRATCAGVELAILLGALGTFANLYALLGGALVLGRSLLGLDVAFMSMFLAPDNGFLIMVLGLATFVLFEPLRAAISALLFVEARARRDGADLDAAIDRVIEEHARGKKPRAAHAASLVFALCMLSSVAVARAEPEASGDVNTTELGRADHAVRSRVAHILTRDEFREIGAGDSRPLEALLERLLAWLDRAARRDEARALARSSRTSGSPYAFMALAAALALGLAWYAHARRKRKRPAPARDDKHGLATAPAIWLDRASDLAERDPRLALRALYLALLTALDRAQRIEYDPSKTNGQYRAGFPPGALRDDFAAFTRIFDRTFYGREPATRADYELCRELAQRISGEGR